MQVLATAYWMQYAIYHENSLYELEFWISIKLTSTAMYFLTFFVVIDLSLNVSALCRCIFKRIIIRSMLYLMLSIWPLFSSSKHVNHNRGWVYCFRFAMLEMFPHIWQIWYIISFQINKILRLLSDWICGSYSFFSN